MLNIGEFAGMTGLTIKALRHYDEKGVLVPADVDAQSGYRRYGEDQVRTGVVVRALRDAGVPLADITAALADGEVEAAVDAHRARVLQDRDSDDRAVEHAHQVLAALASPIEIVERKAAAQPYVGRALAIPNDDDDALTDEDANAQFAQLYAAVQEAGVGPTGMFWTTIRPSDAGTVQIVCCWPTTVQLDPSWGGDETTVEVLPERIELAAIWRPEKGVELPEGATHPAVVALFDAIAERGITMPNTELRQRVLGESVHAYAVEVSITIS